MNKQTIIIVIFLVVLAAVVVAWFVFNKGGEIQVQNTPGGTNEQGSGIGGEIFQKVQNPIADKLPESNPAQDINPLENTYQNPFGE
ncbi:MAG: hypothetical protein AAB738_01985 [Patescibacteria group bacterium]